MGAPRARRYDPGETCDVDGCTKAPKAGGFCFQHYMNNSRHGDPVRERTRPSLDQRFWAKVERTEDCWNWVGTITNGYGFVKVNGGMRSAHRVAWQLSVGPVPDGMDVDHLCRNRRCVNPAHLEPVTHRENVLRGAGTAAVNARKTHCKHGHSLSDSNLILQNGGRTRVCRECRNSRARRRARDARSQRDI